MKGSHAQQRFTALFCKRFQAKYQKFFFFLAFSPTAVILYSR